MVADSKSNARPRRHLSPENLAELLPPSMQPPASKSLPKLVDEMTDDVETVNNAANTTDDAQSD